MRSFLRRNGLSLVLGLLFAASLLGHTWAGWRAENDERRLHGREPQPYPAFLASGDFMETLAENMESEFLQMAAYVLLTVWLRQRGSAESKPLEGEEEVDEDPESHRHDARAPSPVRRGGLALAVYKNSLSLALLGLFGVSFMAHAAGGARAFNEDRAAHGLSERVSAIGYISTSRFWFESLQNWQSEFFSVLMLVLLSIALRQHGSPESKPVHAPHDQTGKG
jgi:Domain of unknown function (DUF6766)